MAIVNTSNPCHTSILYHMNGLHKWLLEIKLAFIGLVCLCACAPASVSWSFVSVAPKVKSCGWDLIVRAAEAVAMALASEGCFMTEGGEKNTVQWLILKASLSRQNRSVCQFLCTTACICVCEWTECHINNPSDPHLDKRKSESAKDTMTLERGWEGIKTAEGQVERYI